MSTTAAEALEGYRRAVTPRGRLSEAALVRAARRGSEDAVAELFDRHWDAAYRTAALVTGDRAAAEDIAQEAFLAALRALPSFDLRRPLRPWLHRIVVNRAIDWSRSRALRAEVGAEVVAEAAAPRDAAQAASATTSWPRSWSSRPSSARSSCCATSSSSRPARSRKLLGLPRGTVNSRLRRGLDALEGVIER